MLLLEAEKEKTFSHSYIYKSPLTKHLYIALNKGKKGILKTSKKELTI